MIKEHSIFDNVIYCICALWSSVNEKPDFIFKYWLYGVVKLCYVVVSVACAKKKKSREKKPKPLFLLGKGNSTPRLASEGLINRRDIKNNSQLLRLCYHLSGQFCWRPLL